MNLDHIRRNKRDSNGALLEEVVKDVEILNQAMSNNTPHFYELPDTSVITTQSFVNIVNSTDFQSFIYVEGATVRLTMFIELTQEIIYGTTIGTLGSIVLPYTVTTFFSRLMDLNPPITFDGTRAFSLIPTGEIVYLDNITIPSGSYLYLDATYYSPNA